MWVASLPLRLTKDDNEAWKHITVFFLKTYYWQQKLQIALNQEYIFPHYTYILVIDKAWSIVMGRDGLKYEMIKFGNYCNALKQMLFKLID